MNKIIQISDEHFYQLPELTLRSEVLFKNENKQNAFWDRSRLIKDYRRIWFEFIPHETLMDEDATWYDQKGMLAKLNKEDSDYIRRTYEQEIRRRTEGVWFKNGDDIEYLTGDHYFLLMWAKMNAINKEFADFWKYQRDFFYLINKIESPDSKALGLFVSKAKKTGITNIVWSGYFLNRATLYKNKNLGCMNIDQKIAAKTFRDYFYYSFNGLPKAFKPEIKSVAQQEGSIEFGAAYSNSKAKRLSAYQDSDRELNTNVFCVPTQPKAFDVAVMNLIWFDECPKYKAPFQQIFNTNKQAVQRGGYKVGRILCTSYTPDEDGESFMQAREIFRDSKVSKAIDGKTPSDLIKWHIPSYASWIGENNECFDKYGNCNEVLANKQIDNGRDKVKSDTRALQALKRQFAKNEREAWDSAGAGSTFDLIRFGELLAEVEDMEENDQDSVYVEGNFEWESPLWEIGLRNKRKLGQFCDVKWVPLSPEDRLKGKTGSFRMYHDVPQADRNAALKQGKDEYGNLIRPDRFNYAVGGDPTSYAAGSEVVQKSKNGGGAIRMPDLSMDAKWGKVVSNVFAIEYYDRPELPAVAYESFLKLIIYTGGVAIIEGNQKYVSTKLMEEGLGYFMIVFDKEKQIMNLWKPYMGMSIDAEKTYQFIQISNNQTGKNEILEYIIRLYKNYFHYPQEGEKDLGKTCKSSRVIKQVMDLDPTDTKKSDLFMGWGYALMACDIYRMLQLEEQEDHEDPIAFSGFLHSLGIDV